MDKTLEEKVEQLTLRNDKRYFHLFKLITAYFDSLDNGFIEYKGKFLTDYKNELIDYIHYFKEKYKIT